MIRYPGVVRHFVNFIVFMCLLEVVGLKSLKRKVFAGVMLPACASLGIASSSTAFARKATKIKKQSIVNKQVVNSENTFASHGASRKLKELKVVSSSVEDSLNKVGNMDSITKDKNSDSEFIDSLGNMNDVDVANFGEMLQNISKIMAENDVISDISSVDFSDSRVKLTTSDVLKINSSELASAYSKAVESGYYDVNLVSAVENSLPGINKEMILSGYFDSQASLSSIGIGIYVNATNLSGDVVGQVCVMPDPQNGKGTVRLQIWAINKENFDATLRLMLRCLGENSKIKRVCVSAPSSCGKNFADSVKSVFDSKPKLFKKFNEIRRTDYMRLDKNNSGEMVLATGSTRSVNGAAPVKEAAHEVVLKKEEISTYKNMISAGKLSVGSGSKDKDGDFLNVISTDYEFVK